MAEVKEKAVESQQAADAREIIELLKKLTNEEKREVKGIMIGLQMSRNGEVQTA